MKFKIQYLFAVVLSFVFNGCVAIHASNIIFDGLTDQNGKPINRDVTLTLLSQPLANGRGLSFDVPKTYRMTNYTVTASNVIGGNFALNIQGLRQSLYMTVLDDTNTYPFMQLVTNSLPTLNTTINLYQFDTNLFVVSGKNVTLKSLVVTNVDNSLGTNVNLTGTFMATAGNVITNGSDSGVAIGVSATTVSGVAIGNTATAANERETAVGNQSTASASGATVLGVEAVGTAVDVVVLGSTSSATSQDAIALGSHTQVSGLGSVAVGTLITLTNNYTIQLGRYYYNTIIPGTLNVFSNASFLSVSGLGGGLTFTNANGAPFRLIVNSTTNGFTFVPQ